MNFFLCVPKNIKSQKNENWNMKTKKKKKRELKGKFVSEGKLVILMAIYIYQSWVEMKT